MTTLEFSVTGFLPLHIRRALAPIAKTGSPGYSWCERCGLPWSVVDGHTTMLDCTNGFFPLCHDCWSELTAHQRLPYYRAAWSRYNYASAGFSWEMVEQAVMREAEVIANS